MSISKYHLCIIWDLLNKFTKERIKAEISQNFLDCETW